MVDFDYKITDNDIKILVAIEAATMKSEMYLLKKIV